MKIVATLMGVVTLVLGAVTGVRADDIGAVMSRVAAKVQELSDVKGRKVGVGHFPLSSGPVTEVGVFLADQLDVALTNRSTAGGYQMVSRSHLCEVIRETRLWVGDQFDPNLTKKLGHFGGADLLALGRITEIGDKLSLSMRIVDTETGRSVWADSHLFDDRDLRALVARPISGGGCGEAKEGVTPTRPPISAPDPLRVEVWADKPVYRIGDTIEFSVRVNRDAYVTLINIGASGDVTVIFPNKFHPRHFMRADQTVVIPAPTWNFSFVVQGPAGFDQIKAVASEEPIALLPGSLSRGEEPAFRSLDRLQTRNIVAAIRTEKEKTAPGRFTERVIAVEVRR